MDGFRAREKDRDAAEKFFEEQPRYTMQGVVNFLSSVSRSQEQAASDWVKEKRRLETRVLELELQCKAHERIEYELTDRVRLLESALREERMGKNSRSMVGTSTFRTPNASQSSPTVVLDKAVADDRVHNDLQSGQSNDEDYDFEYLFREGGAWSERDEPVPEPTWVWQPYAMLRSHLDCVTGVCFHERGSLLLSHSADASLKLWSLKSLAAAAAAWASGSSGAPPPDLEPVITYRGHIGAVLCGGFDDPGGRIFTGGADATVRLWALPPAAHDLYDSPAAGLRDGAAVLLGHAGPVWDVHKHPREPLLLSAAADATLRAWRLPDGVSCGPLGGIVLGPSAAAGEPLVPTAVCVVPADDTKVWPGPVRPGPARSACASLPLIARGHEARE
jgi:hypothetical protein